MEALFTLLILGIPIALAIWLIQRVVKYGKRIDELSSQLRALEFEVYRAKRPQAESLPQEPAPVPELNVTPPAQPVVTEIQKPPPVRPIPEIAKTPLKIIPPVPPPLPKRQPVKPAINWEQFLGVKGFAWIGGFALFLGIAFFIKYSFEHNLIPPGLRVAIGFIVGIGLVAGGMVMSRKNFAALSQTLCGTGIVVLYAITFACRALYHFKFFGPIPTFLLMALITTAAFLLSARLNGLVIAILGMLGGFLTPILLSTGQDNPLGLFLYIAILDTGLILISLNRRWDFLTALAALGTAFMQVGWANKFFESERYFQGNKILIALAVLLGFNLLYLAANWLAKRRAQSNWWLAGANLGLAAVALAFTAYFFTFTSLAQRPLLIFGYVFLIDVMVLALTRLKQELSKAQAVVGFAIFCLLALWTTQHLTNNLLNTALLYYLIFAVLHSVLPAWIQRRQGSTSREESYLNHLFAPLALLLVLIPIFKLQEPSFLVWPFVLLVDLLAITLAVMTMTLLPVLIVLLLTFAATAALLTQVPSDLTGLPSTFFLMGAFSVFFVAASAWLIRKFKPDVFKSGLSTSEDARSPESIATLMLGSSTVLPFLLLIMATLRLRLANPTPLFGLALLLVAVSLGITRIFSLAWMPVVALASSFALEFTWHFTRFDTVFVNHLSPQLLLGWYLIFYAVFTLFPFVFLKKYSNSTAPWIASALAGPAQFLLIYRLVKVAWPNQVMGLLPALFAIPALAGLFVVLKRIPAESKARMTQLAWLGGVALFFITLIFPIQFDRQWVTIGLALEGAALLWLFHRVPHPGLRLTGVGLLIIAFVRLALNPAVLTYHVRTETPIFNWYLYAYGAVIAALFIGAQLLAPPRHLVLQTNARAILGSLGTVLTFLLLNIEIADYFSSPGSTLTFQFSGNFARDMTYSIAWALFALGLLVFGIAKKVSFARYAAMGLLCITLLKLFFHDLARLGQLYRIGAFIGVAIIAMVASFAYQKYFSTIARTAENNDQSVDHGAGGAS